MKNDSSQPTARAADPNTPIGFIGTGVMGNGMAGHLLEAGHPVFVYTRTREKAESLVNRGARWVETPADMARHCQLVFTIVGFPADVEEVYFGEQGLLAAMQPDTILVDMTTSSPELAQRIAEAASENGGRALDAPVSGGDKGAREGTLSIMVGGDREAFDAVRPFFRLMGKNIVYQGGPGSGQHCKMCNQITIASTMVGLCEALAYAESSGLDPETVLQSISTGAAGSWALTHLAPKVLAGDFAPGFYVKHFIKDMSIAAGSAERLGLELPGLQVALERYRQLEARGYGDEGTQALFHLFKED